MIPASAPRLGVSREAQHRQRNGYERTMGPISRRGVALAAAALCVAALTAPARAGESTTVPASAALPAIPAYVARPAAAAARPAVLILHGCEGFNSRYARIADQLASQGYVAVAIDTLRPRDVRNACGERSGSRLEAAYARATLDWMRGLPGIDGARLAVLGYSMGAIAVLDLSDPFHPAAPPPGVLAAVAYYPACRNRTAANLRVPLLILIGDADDWTPAAPCLQLAAAGARLGRPMTIVPYPGATHAFNIDRPDRLAYGHRLQFDAAAASDAWRQSLTFLDRYLGAP
jgi:dienelactone hydrolase